MTPEERLELAIAHAYEARKQINRATEEADPVEQRRQMVRAAMRFRLAADVLDDQGRLTE